MFTHFLITTVSIEAEGKFLDALSSLQGLMKEKNSTQSRWMKTCCGFKHRAKIEHVSIWQFCFYSKWQFDHWVRYWHWVEFSPAVKVRDDCKPEKVELYLMYTFSIRAASKCIYLFSHHFSQCLISTSKDACSPSLKKIWHLLDVYYKKNNRSWDHWSDTVLFVHLNVSGSAVLVIITSVVSQWGSQCSELVLFHMCWDKSANNGSTSHGLVTNQRWL